MQNTQVPMTAKYIQNPDKISMGVPFYSALMHQAFFNCLLNNFLLKLEKRAVREVIDLFGIVKIQPPLLFDLLEMSWQII